MLVLFSMHREYSYFFVNIILLIAATRSLFSSSCSCHPFRQMQLKKPTKLFNASIYNIIYVFLNQNNTRRMLKLQDRIRLFKLQQFVWRLTGGILKRCISSYRHHVSWGMNSYMLVSTGLSIWTCLDVVCCLCFVAVAEHVMEGPISLLSNGLDRTWRLCRLRSSSEKWEIVLCFIKSH